MDCVTIFNITPTHDPLKMIQGVATESYVFMKKDVISRPKFTCVGLKIRTSNRAEFNPVTAQIGATVQRYITNDIASKIPNRAQPQTTYCMYTEYDSDHMGPFSYVVGQRVEDDVVLDLDQLEKQGLSVIHVPAQHYAKFTAGPGIMPHVCIKAWQDIWLMGDAGLPAPRRYCADFEIYDERALDLTQTVLDICIGVEDVENLSTDEVEL